MQEGPPNEWRTSFLGIPDVLDILDRYGRGI
jgi:hypothetical protein